MYRKKLRRRLTALLYVLVCLSILLSPAQAAVSQRVSEDASIKGIGSGSGPAPLSPGTGHASLQAGSITIQNNNFEGNQDYGLNSDVPINAENNWWGDASGPTHASNPDGNGDSVSDNVDFDPWLPSAVDIGIPYSPPPEPGTITLSQNSFEDNGTYGVQSSIPLNAENNWWGHPSGPYHSTLNPDGQGDNVSDNVDFDPWLTTPPAPPATNSVFGHVHDSSGNPIPDVTVSAGAGHSATTDASGAYTISGLTAGTYTLTPSKGGYTFSPATRTVSVPPDATGQDFVGSSGEPAPTPSGFFYLHTMPAYVLPDPLTPLVGVYNPNTRAITYTVSIELRREGATPNTLAQSLLVPAESLASHTFDFGVQAAGTYRLAAELWAEGTLLQTTSGTVNVVPSWDQQKAMNASWRLTRAALWEFQQAQDIVVDAYAQSVAGASWEVIDFFLDATFIDWMDDIGGAANLPSESIKDASDFIAEKLSSLEEVFRALVLAYTDVTRRARQATDAYLNFQRQDVQEREQSFDTFVLTQSFTWTPWMDTLTQVNEEAIAVRVEGHPLEHGFLPPPRFLGTTTLWDEDITFDSYQRIGTWLSWFGLLVAILIIIISVVGSGGTSIPLMLLNLSKLKHLVTGLRYTTTILLIMIALTMDTQTERIIAPAITHYHNQGLTSLEAAIGSSVQNSQSFQLTSLYSADGRLVDILTNQPYLKTQETITLQNQLHLPPGSYRAVTAVHSRDQLGIASEVVTLDVTQPQVDLTLHIVQPQLTNGQTLQASVDIRNTDITTGTGVLGLLIASSDGENLKVEQFSLAAGASHHTSFSFVPPAEGSYVLQAVVIDEEGSELALCEAGYVVGNGPALAVNVGYQPEYSPGVDVSTSITATNAGNQAAFSSLTLVTIDRETAQAIYTQTLSLNLSPGGAHSQDVTVLPNAQPGRYYINLLLDETLHRTFTFLVIAEDTLWVTISASPPSVEPGQSVTLAAQVVNATYTATNASLTVTVIDPQFTNHALAMSQVTTGTYQGVYVPTLSGTYEVNVSAQRPNWRGSEAQTTFTAGQPSWLLLTVEGNLRAGQTRPITVTVRNEQSLPVPGTSVILSGTNELLYRETDAAGAVAFWVSPQVVEPYQMTVYKLGYARTTTTVAVEPFELYLPIILKNH